jgi:dipeptidyl aminopeptidase/acylaminoacyl peptidase
MRLLAALVLMLAGRAAAASCPESASPELLKLALPAVKARAAAIKPWKKDLCVALVETAESEEKRAYGLVLFAAGDTTLSKRVKATTSPIPLGPDDSVASLDLAKYDVTATQTAIGVRTSRHRTYAGGGEAQLDTLILFLQHDGQLEPVLKAFMSYEAELAGEWAEDGTRDRVSYQGKATLVVSKKSTQGHFDLIRKTDSGTQHLRWDGDAYVATDADPFTKDVLDIFDEGP